MDSTILLPGDVLCACDAIEMGNYFIKTGENLVVIDSVHNRRDELCVSLRTSLTNQYDPNTNREAEIWVHYSLLEGKTKLIEEKWNIHDHICMLVSLYKPQMQFCELTVMELIACIFLFHSLCSKNLVAFSLYIILIIYFCCRISQIQKSALQIPDVVSLLENAKDRISQSEAYQCCVSCLRKNGSFVKRIKKIGIIQTIAIFAALGVSYAAVHFGIG